MVKQWRRQKKKEEKGLMLATSYENINAYLFASISLSLYREMQTSNNKANNFRSMMEFMAYKFMSYS